MDTSEVGLAPATRLRKRLAWWGASMAAVVLLGAGGQAARSAAAPAPSPPTGIVRVGGEVKPPVKISGDGPVYTEVARRARVTGVVILEAVIDEHGTVTDTRILKGLPMGLDGAAVDAVKTWKFRPAVLRSKPVPVYFILTVNFQLTTDFDFGSAFSGFLSDHPGLRPLMEQQDYAAAGVLIDRWLADDPENNSLRLGRAYMHLGAEEMADAWRVAQSVSGLEEAEIAQSIADKAAELLRAHPGASATDRMATVEVGLPAATLATRLISDDNPEGLADALRTKAELLRAQAELVRDEARRRGLLDEAKRLDARADAVHPPGSLLE